MVSVSISAVIFGWLQEGSLEIRRSFAITVSDSDALLHYFPRPIVVDLFSDKKPRLIACSRQDHLSVYPVYHGRRNFQNIFVAMTAEKVVPLYADVVGLAAGFIATSHKEQVIAVVTSDYRLTLLSAQLQTLWTVNVVSTARQTIDLHHAAVAVLPERVYEQDQGVIVVALKIGGLNGTEATAIVAYAGDSGERRWEHLIDHYSVGRIGQAAGEAVEGTGEKLLLTTASLTEHYNDLPSHASLCKDERTPLPRCSGRQGR